MHQLSGGQMNWLLRFNAIITALPQIEQESLAVIQLILTISHAISQAPAASQETVDQAATTAVQAKQVISPVTNTPIAASIVVAADPGSKDLQNALFRKYQESIANQPPDAAKDGK
jgi:hypothetical protein